MSQPELAAWLESRDAHWCSQYPAALAPDEESEIVAQFLAAPYPYPNDDDEEEEQEQKHQHHNKLGEISATSSTYWPEPGHVTDPGNGACYWPPYGAASNRNSSGNGAYFDGSGCCCYYLAEPDVSLGINTRTTLLCTSSIDLNLLGDGEEEGTASVVHPAPNPSPADHTHTADHRNGGDDGAAARAAVSLPKRKALAGNDGGDLGRHKKKEKKAASKTAQKFSQESSQSKGSCSADESLSNRSEVNRRSGANGGVGNAKARAAKGSATDPQSLYARRRRERINERLKILQKLVPNGTKVDISTMLEEAVHYVRFLQQQIKMLSSDEMWMYAPIAYNGMSLGIDLKISTLQ